MISWFEKDASYAKTRLFLRIAIIWASVALVVPAVIAFVRGKRYFLSTMQSYFSAAFHAPKLVPISWLIPVCPFILGLLVGLFWALCCIRYGQAISLEKKSGLWLVFYLLVTLSYPSITASPPGLTFGINPSGWMIVISELVGLCIGHAVIVRIAVRGGPRTSFERLFSVPIEYNSISIRDQHKKTSELPHKPKTLQQTNEELQRINAELKTLRDQLPGA